MRHDSYPRCTRAPSFSFTLLHAIYRSKSNLDETHKVKQRNLRHNYGVSVGKKDEDWMEKQSSHSSSETECSSAGFFSSSETETTYRLRPTSKSQRTHNHKHMNSEKQKQKQKQKAKQPVSPGSRIASFLSSIFNSGNVKKAKTKMCYVGGVKDVSFEQKSVSSSTNSSISRRSCMRKTPSSAKVNKCSSNGVKRSVRFYPVSVILGEDDPNLLPLPSVGKITTSSSVKDEKNEKSDFRVFYNNDEDNDDEDEDDVLSYSSSDLFELDHLIGDWRYQEELPVYETTDLETNKAIAHALRL